MRFNLTLDIHLLPSSQVEMVPYVMTAMLALALGMCITVVYGMRIVVKKELARRAMRQSAEVIWVQESPPPTRVMTTPPSQLTTRRRAARGARRLRFSMHRRRQTRTYDPAAKGHCGYACALKAANKKVTPASIKLIRAEVAQKVYEGFVFDHYIIGQSIKQLVNESDLTLADYIEKTKHTQWASTVEVAIAAQQLGISVIVQEKHRSAATSLRPRWIISLKNQHFTLAKLHRRVVSFHEAPSPSRGGMRPQMNWTQTGSQFGIQMQNTPLQSEVTIQTRPVQAWTWESRSSTAPPLIASPVPGDVPTTQPHTPLRDLPPRAQLNPKVIKVNILPSVRADIRYLEIIVDAQTDIYALRKRVAEVLNCSFDRLAVRQRGAQDDMPGWVQVVSEVDIADTWRDDILYDTLEVILDSNYAFTVRFRVGNSHEAVKELLAGIVRTPAADLKLCSRDGTEWVYPDSRRFSAEVHLLRTLRGGMRSSPAGTVSPTQPYESDNNEQDQQATQELYGTEQTNDQHPENEEQQLAMRMMRASRSRSRSRRSMRSPSSGSSINSARLRSEVMPPDAQELDRISRDVRDPQGVIGQIRAQPEAVADQVLEEVQARIHAEVPPRKHPRTAMLWRDVQSVILPHPVVPEGANVLDLRRGRWELYQPLRYIPLTARGELRRLIVVPESISHESAQIRVERAATRGQHWQVIAVSYDNWIAQPLMLPEHIQLDLLSYDEMVRAQRGGMRQPIMGHTVAHVALAINPNEIHAFEVNADHSIEDLIKQMSAVIGLFPYEILLATATHIPKLEDKVQSYPGLVFMAYPTSFFHDGLKFWNEDPMQLWNKWFQQWGLRRPTMYRPLDSQQIPRSEPLPTPTSSPQSFAPGDNTRGGARKPVRSSQEQRSVMLTWAIDKAKRELPQISVPTITMMMKAEMRTVSSVLHSRSAMQTYQVLQAAYRRANLQLPREVQPVSQSRSRTSSPVRNTDEENQARQVHPSAEENEGDQTGPASAPPELSTSPTIVGEHSQGLINELAAMRQAMANQAVITGQILDIMSAMPKNSDYMALVQAVKAQSEAHAESSMHIARMVSSLEQRLTEWECTYLPTVLERLPHGVPASPTTSRDEQEPPPVEGFDASTFNLEAVREQDQLHTSVVRRMQEASLHSSCVRVVESGEANRRAVRPFRAAR